MKKIVSLILACSLLLCCVFVLTSCGGPSGEYEGALGVGTYKFSGSKYTLTTTALGVSKMTEGTFKMGKDDNGNKTIIFTPEGDNATTVTSSFSEGEEDGKAYIAINGIKYYKK